MKKIVLRVLSFVFLTICGVVGFNFASADFSASAEGVEYIGSAERFVEVFTTQNTYNNSDIVINLTAPLNFEGVDLSEISKNKNVFMGTFDGKGYSVSNLTLTSSCLYYGLIPYAKDATIQNLRVEGSVDFVFDEQNIQEVYAGVLVGYGENLTIKNCELDNAIVDEFDGTTTYASVDIPVYSNFNFGFLAGKLKGNPNASSQTMPANITNCINYYDGNVVLNKYTNISVGGLVGVLENCYMLNCMNYGDLTYSKLSNLTSENTLSQYFGGIAGTINGSGLYIRNTIFGGTINSFEDVSGVNDYVGAITGGTISTATNALNINFDYYTQASLKPSGDDFISLSEKVCSAENINKAFVTNQENFDQSVGTWDFDKTWILSNSRFHIQNFQRFEYNFNNILDRSQILESAVFRVDGETSSLLSARYSTAIDIILAIKSEYQGYYVFSNILLNNNTFAGDYEITAIENGGKISGYEISINANATTSGTYSFVVAQVTYDCVITVSDEAKANSQGGVRVQSASIASTPSQEFNMTFAYNSDIKRIVAEGEDIYSFDHWELLYKDENGEYTGEPVTFDQANNSTVTISFGTAPFNREFKLVAYFTDAEAIKVGFGEIDETLIKEVILAGELYTGEQVQMASSRIVRFEVVTQTDYILNIEAISASITELYGSTPSPYPALAQEPSINEVGETTYVFQIDLNYAKDNIDNNELSIDIVAMEDTSNDKNDLLWLFIALPIVAVIAIGIIIFFIIRRRNGGGKGGKTKSPQKQKEKGYKDYYA